MNKQQQKDLLQLLLSGKPLRIATAVERIIAANLPSDELHIMQNFPLLHSNLQAILVKLLACASNPQQPDGAGHCSAVALLGILNFFKMLPRLSSVCLTGAQFLSVFSAVGTFFVDPPSSGETPSITTTSRGSPTVKPVTMETSAALVLAKPAHVAQIRETAMSAICTMLLIAQGSLKLEVFVALVNVFVTGTLKPVARTLDDKAIVFTLANCLLRPATHTCMPNEAYCTQDCIAVLALISRWHVPEVLHSLLDEHLAQTGSKAAAERSRPGSKEVAAAAGSAAIATACGSTKAVQQAASEPAWAAEAAQWITLQQLGFCQLIAFKAQLTQGILKELLQAESDFATHLRACDLSPLLSRLHLQCVRGTASATLEGQAVRLLQQSWLPVEWARMDACAFGAGSCGTSNADILLRMLAGGQAVPNVVTGPAKALRPQGSAVQPAISATGTGISTVGGSTSTAVPSPSCHASTHESPAKAALAAMTAAAAAVPRASSTGVSLSYESMLAAQASSYHSSTVAAAGTRLTRHFAQVWYQALCQAERGMPHALAYEEGVRVLLQGGLLRATKQGLYNVLALATMDRFDTYLSLASCLGMLAWYAERFPAVCAGLAAEHVAVSRKRALRKQQQDTPAATLFLLPTLQPAAGSSSVSASAVEWTHTGMQESLWELLQRMPAETAALGVDPRLLPESMVPDDETAERPTISVGSSSSSSQAGVSALSMAAGTANENWTALALALAKQTQAQATGNGGSSSIDLTEGRSGSKALPDDSSISACSSVASATNASHNAPQSGDKLTASLQSDAAGKASSSGSHSIVKAPDSVSGLYAGKGWDFDSNTLDEGRGRAKSKPHCPCAICMAVRNISNLSGSVKPPPPGTTRTQPCVSSAAAAAVAAEEASLAREYTIDYTSLSKTLCVPRAEVCLQALRVRVEEQIQVLGGVAAALPSMPTKAEPSSQLHQQDLARGQGALPSTNTDTHVFSPSTVHAAARAGERLRPGSMAADAVGPAGGASDSTLPQQQHGQQGNLGEPLRAGAAGQCRPAVAMSGDSRAGNAKTDDNGDSDGSMQPAAAAGAAELSLGLSAAGAAESAQHPVDGQGHAINVHPQRSVQLHGHGFVGSVIDTRAVAAVAAWAAALEGCAGCGKASREPGALLQLCGGCKAVRYCSESCQAVHWWEGGHQRLCKRLAAAGAVALQHAGQQSGAAVAGIFSAPIETA